jgi:hypothetical protein
LLVFSGSLFVYSNSPIRHNYVEDKILPRLGRRAITLNWSHRSRWWPKLAVLAFRFFGGHRAFNPMALVFWPFRPARKFRFYEPFREFKHGNTEPVAERAKELFDFLKDAGKRRSA